MKNYIILFAILFCLSSCNDFLVLEPHNQINEISFYKNANDYNAAILGTYTNMQGLHDAWTLHALAELPTDNAWTLWSSPSVNEMEAGEVEFTSTNGFVAGIWDNCFRTIARCNNILSQIENTSLEDNDKRQFEGEAKFLRAYNYFYLVRFFGDLPKITTSFRSPEEVNTYDWTRNPAEEIYDLIITDLTDAASLLESATDLPKTRASVGAAKTVLGKVYLTRKDYSQAESVLKEVIDLGIYSLQPNYKTLFSSGNDELAETIFEIPYISGNIGEGNNYTQVFAPENFDMAIFPNNAPGAGRIVVTPDLANDYEEGDLRREVIFDSLLLTNGSYAKVKYGIKFMDFNAIPLNDGSVNFTALRYADVLLMYSEVLNELNQSELAHDYLNMVRERADIDPLNGLSKEAFALVMEHERRVEFAQEGHRWFDLVRTNRLQPVMNKYFQNNGLAFSVEEHEVLLPIPQDEIEINPTLQQNDGY